MAHVRTLTRATGKPAYEVRWVDGGRHRQRTFTSARAAERWALKMENELAEGASTERYRKTTHTVADAWAGVVAEDALALKRNTIDRYDQVWRNQVAPRWARRRARDVTTDDVRAWIADLVGGGLALASARKALQVLSKAMAYAVERGWAATSPCAPVEKKWSKTNRNATPMTDGEHVALTVEQIDALAAELATEPPFDLLVRFAAWSGLRAGELTALRIQDVNALVGEVSVTRTMYRQPGGTWRVDTPKTRSSARVVAILDEPLLADLRVYLADVHPHADDGNALLWPAHTRTGTPDYSRPFNHRLFARWTFAPAAERAGLPEQLRWHDLRHTAASLLLASGMSVWEVAGNLGHEETKTTEAIYGHRYIRRDHTAARARVAAMRAEQSAEAAPVVPLAAKAAT